MNIDQAIIEDVPELIPLVELFAKRIKQEKYFNRKEVANALAHMINHGCLYTLEEDDGLIVGLIGGVFTSSIWNPHVKLFSEEIFYIAPKHRGTGMTKMMLAELTEHVINLGAQMVSVKKMYNSPRMEYLYNSLGFNELETMYMKEA